MATHENTGPPRASVEKDVTQVYRQYLESQVSNGKAAFALIASLVLGVLPIAGLAWYSSVTGRPYAYFGTGAALLALVYVVGQAWRRSVRRINETMVDLRGWEPDFDPKLPFYLRIEATAFVVAIALGATLITVAGVGVKVMDNYQTRELDEASRDHERGAAKEMTAAATEVNAELHRELELYKNVFTLQADKEKLIAEKGGLVTELATMRQGQQGVVKELGRLRSAAGEKDGQIRTLRNMIAERDGRLKSIGDRLDKAEHAIDTLREQNKRLNEDIIKAEKAIYPPAEIGRILSQQAENALREASSLYESHVPDLENNASLCKSMAYLQALVAVAGQNVESLSDESKIKLKDIQEKLKAVKCEAPPQ